MKIVQKLIAICALIGTPIADVSTEACPEFENQVKTPSQEPPPPKLVFHAETLKADKFVNHLESNVALVNTTSIISVRLDCWAPYPIDLHFAGHLTNQRATTVKTFRKEFGSVENPQSCFLINATLESYEQITGNYSCVSVENPKIAASYYIFAAPVVVGVILTRGQTIVLQSKPEQTTVIFPCAVSQPDANVKLLKENRELSLSNDLRYDPKLGFTMSFAKGDDAIFGRYTCQTELMNDKVFFTLLPPKRFKIQPPVSSIQLEPQEQLNVSCLSAEEFFIDYFPVKTIPTLTNEVTPIDTSLPNAHYKYVGRFISKPLSPRLSGYVNCKWKANNETFAQWTFSVSEKVPSHHVNSLDIRKVKAACTNKTATELVLYDCSNSVECRINSCIRKDDSTCQSNSRTCSGNQKSACLEDGLIQCVSDVVPVSEVFFTAFSTKATSNKTNRYVSWEHVAEDELLLLKDASESSKSRNKPDLQLSCRGSNFVFSSGFKWTIIYKNKTKISLSSNDKNPVGISLKNSWGEKKSVLKSVLTIPFKLASAEISTFECSAPVWNSWKWISQKISMDSLISSRRKNENSALGGPTLTSISLLIISVLISCWS